MSITIDRELIEHAIALFLMSPTHLLIPRGENFNIQTSIFIQELIEIITIRYVNLDNSLAIRELLSDIITKVNTSTMSTLSLHTILHSKNYSFILIANKIKKFITHYFKLVNRYAKGYINAYTVNQASELNMISKLYIPTDITVYISDATVRMQSVLILKTRR